MKSKRLIYPHLKKAAKLLGYDLALRRIGKNKEGEYEIVIPRATYAPWLSDKHFQQAFDMVKNHSMVDKYRCYELWQLVAESRKVSGALIEIGVWRGGTGALIAKSAELNDIKDTVYLCDTFSGVAKTGKMDSSYSGREHADASQEMVEELVFEKLKLNNIKILTGVFPDDTASLINENRFCFCHIDVDVYQSAKDIVDWIWPKMPLGAIIVYDDYGFIRCDGITKFVNEQRKHKDRLIIHNLNGHAVVVKIKEK